MGKSGNPAKAAAQEAEKATAPEAPEVELNETGTEDFDAFWSSRTRRVRTTKIMGETVSLPPALPLQFEMEAKRLERSSNEDDVRKLVGILFGPDALDRWIAKGMDTDQFKVLLAWAPLAIHGADVTLAEVAEAVLADDAEGQTPDPH